MNKGVFVTNEQVRLTGSPNVARFLAQCLYWSNIEMVQQRQGWFYKSRDEWQAETWLSRYQQEKARTQLRSMGLLEEKHERRNTGIRLWFRLNTALYYALLNTLPEQSESGQVAGDIADVLHESALSERSENNITDYSYNYESSSYSNYIVNNETIVLNTDLNESYKPENGTIVLDNISIEKDKSSDNHCINNDGIESIECVETEESVEADASPLPADLTDCSDKKHRIDPETFLFCHPFIYQFIRYCHNSASDEFLETLVRFGFAHFSVQAALVRYVERHGHAILEYYRQNAPVELQPLTRADIDDAVRASLEV